MNRVVRAILGAFAVENMKEKYATVRRWQRLITPPTKPRDDYQILDAHLYAAHRSHEIPVRIFRPKEQLHDDVLLFFHGGGWVIGDIDVYTPTCLAMADSTNRVVFSVDYRLAPEHPYPAGLDDCYEAASMLLTHLELTGLGDASRITLIGDSAGANLAAALSLRLRDEGRIVPARQILLYPVTWWDHGPASESRFESIRQYGTGLRLTRKEVQDFMELYAPDVDVRLNPYVSPLMATDFTRQPDTLLITAELDLLRDEGEAYAQRLHRAGNRVVVHRVQNAVHGFIQLPRFLKPVTDAYEQINAFLDGSAVNGAGTNAAGR